MNQIQLDIVGRGNLAWHLEQNYAGKADVNMVNPHTLQQIRSTADVVLVCVKDDVIADVFSSLPDLQGIVCHTSGATNIDVIPNRFCRRGVFYPMNTFTKGLAVNMRQTPIFVEGTDASTLECLKKLGLMISDIVCQADSHQREILHIGAVLSCNYVNHLWALSDELLGANGLDFDMLKPLIHTTYVKMLDNRPADIQTGPAVRHDVKTLEKHISRLHETPLEDIYRVLANSIMNDNKIAQ